MAMGSDDLSSWLARQIEERSWSARELARRADVSHTPVVRAVSGQSVPSPEICIAVARALEVPPEVVLRMAGHLPAVPAEVEDEREVIGLYRRLDGPVRRSILETMRSLLGLRWGRPAMAEERTDYGPEPHTLNERLAYQVAQELETMHPDDREAVLRLMERLQGDRRGALRPDGAPVSPE